MKQILKAMLCALMAFAFTAAVAAEHGTLDDAKAMVKKARAYMKAQGPEKAFAEFSNPKGQFVDRDVYIFVYDKSGKNVAHGANARLVGKDLIDMRDSDGNYLIKGLLEVAGKGGGTYPYKFLNPTTKAVEPKVGYVEMEGEYMVGSGVYAK